MLLCANSIIHVAARSSRLSRAQVVEVLRELNGFYPHIHFTTSWVATTGDRDLTTSLRLLDKSDFFTREIDEMLLGKECRIAIHSAKDLPDPLSEGLQIVAVTRGVDASDSLVLRPDTELADIRLVGVSCSRREEAVRKLVPHARFSDIRGTVDHRLEQLEQGFFDAIVVAEAALIRLGLTYLNRIRLDGQVAPWQGRLAVLARQEDQEMEQLFWHIDDHTLSRVRSYAV